MLSNSDSFSGAAWTTFTSSPMLSSWALESSAADAETRWVYLRCLDQADNAVASDALGNFVVVWRSADQDGSGHGIYARRYNSAGAAQGGEFRVNTTTAGDQVHPA